MRKQLGLSSGVGRRPAGRSVTSGGKWKCPKADCSELEPFTRWVDVERHQQETGHGRYEIVLDC